MKAEKARMQQEQEARITRKSAQIARPQKKGESPYIAAIEATRLNAVSGHVNSPKTQTYDDVYSTVYRENYISGETAGEEARLKKEKEAAYITATEAPRLKDVWSYTDLPTSGARDDVYSNAYRENHVSIDNNAKEVNLEKDANIAAMETTRLKNVWSHLNSQKKHSHDDAYSAAYREARIFAENTVNEAKLKKEKEDCIAAQEGTRLKNIWSHVNSQKSRSRDDAYSTAYARATNLSPMSTSAGLGTNPSHSYTQHFRSQEANNKDFDNEHRLNGSAYAPTTTLVSRLEKHQTKFVNKAVESLREHDHSAISGTMNIPRKKMIQPSTRSSIKKGTTSYISNYETPFANRIGGSTDKTGWAAKGSVNKDVPQRKRVDPPSRKMSTYISNYQVPFDERIGGNPDKTGLSVEGLENTDIPQQNHVVDPARKINMTYISNYETPFANRIGGSTDKTGWSTERSIHKDVPQRKYANSTPVKRGTQGYISNYHIPFDKRIGGNPDKTDCWNVKGQENKNELKTKKMNYSSPHKKDTLSYISNYETDYADRIGGNPHKTERRDKERANDANERQIPQNLFPASHEEL